MLRLSLRERSASAIVTAFDQPTPSLPISGPLSAAVFPKCFRAQAIPVPIFLPRLHFGGRGKTWICLIESAVPYSAADRCSSPNVAVILAMPSSS